MAASTFTPDERNEWKTLFALADRLNGIDPWAWMGPADCFGVSIPEWEEPCFVLFGGQSGAFRNVRFLIGWKALYDFVTRMAEPAKQVAAWLLEIRMLELLYVSADLLFEHERPLLRALRRKAGDTCVTPMFRSVIPGYHPWLPDARERTLLEAALYQAFGMAMRVEADPTLLRGRFPHEALLRKRAPDGTWQDVWSPVLSPPDEEVDVRIEAERLQAALQKPLKRATLQVDLVFTPLRLLPGGTRPQTAYVLLAVDAESGFIVGGELLQATDGVAQMWAQVPNLLLSLFVRFGGCPDTIEIRSDRMANLLRPLGERVPFKMVRREKLVMLDQAREHLSASITGALPKKQDARKQHGGTEGR